MTSAGGPRANESTRLAREVLTGLVEGGVREVVLAPGSRSAPLAFAAHQLARTGVIRLHTRIDERTAAFLALGLAKVTGRPAAVVTTSGTAAANLHPALAEAAHAGVPLVAVTADRPARLRGTSANQTTDQVGIFPLAVFVDLSAGDLGDPAGDLRTPARTAVVRELLAPPPARPPLHLNVRFGEPLVPDASWPEPPRPAPVTVPAEPAQTLIPVVLPSGPRTVVVAGDDAGPPARVLAEQAGWPLLAEPTSGARTGGNALRCYRLLLAGELGRLIERVVVYGHPTLSRPVTRLLERTDVEVWAAAARGVWNARPFAVAGVFERAVPQAADDPGWLARWLAADRVVATRLDALLAGEPGLTPYAVAGAVGRAVPPGGLLFVGASSPIRDLDLMVSGYAVGDRRKLVANRGLSGIDGTVSSAVGAALGRPTSSRALALVGDVTFLHDATGLVLGPDEPRPALTIVVVNDDGGSIFAVLEQGAPEYADAYERLFGTPHRVSLAELCAATGTRYRRAASPAGLEQALASPSGGLEVVEAPVRRDDRRDLDARIRGLVPPG